MIIHLPADPELQRGGRAHDERTSAATVETSVMKT